MMVEIKVKRLLKLVLSPQIWPHHRDVVHTNDESQPYGDDNPPSSAGCSHQRDWGVLRLPDGWSRTGERNQPANPKIARSRGSHGADIVSNSSSFLIKGFLSRINNGHIANAGNELSSSSTNWRRWSLGLNTSSTSMSPTTTSCIMRE